MAIKDIIDEINESATSEAQSILAEAKAEAKSMMDKAKTEGEEHLKKELEMASKDAQMLTNTFESQARLQKNQRLLYAKEELIQQVLDKARSELASDNSDQYKEFVKKGVESGIKMMGSPLTVEIVRPADESLVASIPGVTVDRTSSVDGPDAPLREQNLGGVVLKASDGRSMDMTLKGTMERMMPQLRATAAEQLFG